MIRIIAHVYEHIQLIIGYIVHACKYVYILSLYCRPIYSKYKQQLIAGCNLNKNYCKIHPCVYFYITAQYSVCGVQV